MTLLVAWASLGFGADEYVAAGTCAGCHAEIAARYGSTGMGRSAGPASGAMADWAAGVFEHARSRRSFEPLDAGGRLLLRRFQGDGENVLERTADVVIGSGNHAQTFLHRARTGTWIELPLSWYAERGGYWAMSPGYDQPRHAGFRRVVDERCLSCHTAYPRGDAEVRAIDCQRCHGPGGEHAASGGGAIVNPARLAPERELDVCLQCHLQSTSRPLPDAVRRFGREADSFRPGERLGDYQVSFDHREGAAQREKFEVNGAGYQLLRSACFAGTGAAGLRCTTCHDPHGEAREGATRERAVTACGSCHGGDLGEGHPAAGDCLGCHMPKRRTEDAVHVAMHDHSIPRLMAGGDWREAVDELQAAEAARYAGEVALFYPRDLPEEERRLYEAVAQVKDGANLAVGIARLEALLGEESPAEGWFWLGEAQRRAGDCAAAVGSYEKAREGGVGSGDLEQFLGECLLRLGAVQEAAHGMAAALEQYPAHGGLLLTSGVAAGQMGEVGRSLSLLERAVVAEPERTLAWVNLGASYEAGGRPADAEAAYREAVRVQPDHAFARTHLATLLLGQGRAEEARGHLESALLDDARHAPAHLQMARLAADAGDVAAARASYAQAARWGTPAVRDAALGEAAELSR